MTKNNQLTHTNTNADSISNIAFSGKNNTHDHGDLSDIPIEERWHPAGTVWDKEKKQYVKIIMA